MILINVIEVIGTCQDVYTRQKWQKKIRVLAQKANQSQNNQLADFAAQLFS